MDKNERKALSSERLSRRRKRKAKNIILITAIILVAVLVLSLVLFGVVSLFKAIGGFFTNMFAEKPEKTKITIEQIVSDADFIAAGYDYDAAIAKITSFDENYAENEVLKAAVDRYTAKKAELVPYPSIYEITHVFFHTLITDNSLAFDGDYKEAGYNQYMTTISEFNKMMEEMYKRDFVLVRMHDIAELCDDGNGNMVMKKKEILLPPGKKPFVLSQDDVSYYGYMTSDGFATKMVIDENNNPTCEYVNPDGTVTYGSFDMVPLLEDFIKKHPDFSYRGARAVLAITGYDGVLGYRTCPSGEGYNPDDAEKAKKVADRLREIGYEFASHSWGHQRYGDITYEKFVTDADKWEKEVEPILGDTDILIYANGVDIAGIEEYTYENEKFSYLKGLGFDYFCNVDSNQYWVQLGNDYLRQGRRNLDGYRMYHFPEMLTDLFNVSDVWDSERPTPVPTI